MTSVQNIVQAAQATPSLSTLVAAIKKAGLADTLSNTGPYTVLAPSNAAFVSLLQELKLTPEQLLGNSNLGYILQNHVVNGRFTTSDVINAGPNGVVLKTLNGSQILLKAIPQNNGASYHVQVQWFSTLNKSNMKADVIMPDVILTNGVVHGINRVII